MPSTRLPRFQRATQVAPMIIMPRDREIIQLVQRHRFLCSQQVVLLVPGSSQQILRRLQKLYHHGFLERPRAQIDYYREGGSRPLVYGLGSKGASLLSRENGLALHKNRSGERNRSVGRIFLEHALLVSQVMVTLELACRKAPRVRLVTEDELLNERGLPVKSFQWRVSLNTKIHLGIIPDRVFALEFSDVDGNLSRAFFFLEADRGTMPVQRQNITQTSFYRKLLAYAETWSQSIHRNRFGFHRFRVLTITTSAARVRSLVEACSQLRNGHGLFLFGEERILNAPDLLHSPIWQTGRNGEVRSLLES
jgi:hypothetical protein